MNCDISGLTVSGVTTPERVTQTPKAVPNEFYPKILIVNGEPIGAATASGITLKNLFALWPHERLAQIVTSSLAHEHLGCFEYRLRTDERYGVGRLRKWMGSPQVVRFHAEAGRRPLERAGGKHIREALRSGCRKWLDLIPYALPSQVEKMLVQFHPHLVYSSLGNIQISALALHCAQLCGVSVVPHFMDSWMSTMYAGRLDLAIQRRRLVKAVEGIVGSAPVGMAISDAMAEEYSAAYGIEFHSFMNCTVVPSKFQPEAAVDPAVGPRMVYVGGLHLGRWRSLKEIGEALVSVNALGIPGKLYVYAPAKDLSEFRDRLKGPSVEVAGSLAVGEIPDVLKSGHVMVHVESFEKSARDYTRLSMSTKIPQYMAAGRPLLCYAPGEIASSRFVMENECGLVAGSRERAMLVAALGRILRDADLRNRMGKKAWATAREQFSAADVRERFRAVMAQAAQRETLALSGQQQN